MNFVVYPRSLSWCILLFIFFIWSSIQIFFWKDIYFFWYFMCFSSFDISTEACSVLYTAVLDSFGLFGPAWEYTGSQSNKSPPPEWWMFCFCLLFALFFEILFENSWQWFLLSSHFKELLMKFVWTFCLTFGFTSIFGTAPVQGACTMSIIWPIY